MVLRPDTLGAFHFITLARLRALQLSAGCVPRVEAGRHIAVTAQLEVAAGKVVQAPDEPADSSDIA